MPAQEETRSINRISVSFCATTIVALGLVMPFASNGSVILLGVAALAMFQPVALLRFARETPILVWLGLILLLGWSLVSLVWTPEPDTGKALRTSLIFVGTAILAARIYSCKPRELALLRKMTLVSIVTMIVAFGIEAATSGAITKLLVPDSGNQATERVARGIVLLAILLMPAAASLGKTITKGSLIIFVFGSASIFFLPMGAASAGLMVGTLTFLAVFYFRRPGLAILGVAFVTYVATAPLISTHLFKINTIREMGFLMPPAQEHRIGIWTYTSNHALNQMPHGAGFDSARHYGRQGDGIEEMTGSTGYAPAAMPLHPHNGVLQAWLELGIPGALSLCLIVVGLIMAIGRLQNKLATAAAATSLVAAIIPFLLSFGLWQAWWLSSLSWGAVLTLLLLRRPTVADSP